MIITDPTYVDPEQTCIKASINGADKTIPNDAPGNRHYDELMRQVAEEGLVIADYVEPSE